MQRSLVKRLRALGDRIARRMSAPTLKIGVSARILHPQPGGLGLQSKTRQYLEQTAAHWLMSRDWTGDRMRDEYEMELLHEFSEAGKPVLGICRGLQLINVAMGGTLYQDINRQVAQAHRHLTDAYEKNLHAVRFEPGSALARMYPGVTEAQVNSIHHQSVKTLGRNLRVEAWSEPDRVIEAIRGTGPGFVLGVQWHPEFHAPGDAAVLDSDPILDEFLRAARG